MKTMILAGLAVMFAAQGYATMITKDVDYKDGAVTLQGYLAYDDAVAGKRPGVLVFHEWKGPTSYERGRAEQLAQMGYVAFVADVYGKNVRPKTPDECRIQATKYRSDRVLMRHRAYAALVALKKQKNVDPRRLAAIGFCFGGTAALELARSGADLAGVVTFHGGLDSPTPQDARNIKAKILVLHGTDDPTMSPEVVAGFQKEMRDAGVDWQFISYGGTRHAFSNPATGTSPTGPVAYNEKSATRAWAAMKAFFKEIFGE